MIDQREIGLAFGGELDPAAAVLRREDDEIKRSQQALHDVEMRGSSSMSSNASAAPA